MNLYKNNLNSKSNTQLFFQLILFVSLLYTPPIFAALDQQFTDSGAAAGDIQTTVDNFRTALGALNSPDPVSLPDGRRQINWDAAPAAVSAPNAFPGDFFNFNANPRARGAEFTTPGTGFQLSGDVDDGTPIEFDNINATYSAEFTTFSAERLFTPIGSNIVEVRFFNPATGAAATSNGFGAVFTDIDLASTSKLEFFNKAGTLLHTMDALTQDGGLSFIGATFTSFEVFRVVITLGNIALGASTNDGGGNDVVVLDDFIYGEPQTIISNIPTLSQWGLIILALLLMTFGTLKLLQQQPLSLKHNTKVE